MPRSFSFACASVLPFFAACAVVAPSTGTSSSSGASGSGRADVVRESSSTSAVVTPAVGSASVTTTPVASADDLAFMGHYPRRIVAVPREVLAAEARQAQQVLEPREPLERLIAGNARFVAGKTTHARRDGARRTEVAQGQKPFAVIVACSDSRVTPEVLFDQGLGDLFVVRCAGNVVDDLALGSIEYAVEHLGARLVVVVGHERCGAVTAALEEGHAPGHVAHLIEAIRPNLGDLPTRGKAALDDAVRANAAAVAEKIATSEPILSEQEHQGKLRVLAARYDLDTGAIEFLTPTRP